MPAAGRPFRLSYYVGDFCAPCKVITVTPSIDTQLVVGVIEDTPFPLDVPFEVTTATVAAQ